MRAVLFGVLTLAALSAAPRTETFTGVISDNMCARGGHAQMRMGPTDAECTTLCVMLHDAAYVLADGKNVYALKDQKAPEKFAGEKVRITGTLDASTYTITVTSISRAK